MPQPTDKERSLQLTPEAAHNPMLILQAWLDNPPSDRWLTASELELRLLAGQAQSLENIAVFLDETNLALRDLVAIFKARDSHLPKS